MIMRFSVLGPVRAWRGDVELDLGPPKQRALLALLLTQAGHPVTVTEIVDILWGQNPPESAVNVVHRHIGALRRLFEPDMPTRGVSSQWLVRGSGGYRLEVDTDALDLLKFRALRDQAEQGAQDGRRGRATELLIEALTLWRGPAASGIAPQVRSHPIFVAVDGEHLAALKTAADYALEAEPPLAERVLAMLRPAAAHHPLDEVLQARLMVVLAATGHQAEALEVYQIARIRLADDLGLDPGTELQAAQQQVLRQLKPAEPLPSAESTADSTAEPVNSTITSTIRPAQLPADLAAFAGRRSELAQSDALLPEIGIRPSAVVISAIGGMAGIGKTTLAVHWAHQVAEHFPDGQLYLNLRGFHPTGSIMSVAEAIRSLLDSFGIPAHQIPAGLDAQTAMYRSLLAGRRVLIVLDNVRDDEHARPLLPGAPGCLAIVTSRNQLSGLVAGEGARPITLDVLSEPDALEFLTRRLGEQRVALERRSATQIARLCGCLPLALAIVSARAAMNPAFTLDSIAAELREKHGSLEAFAGEGPRTNARAVFSWSYRTLTPAAARLFRLLALHPGPDCGVSAVAALSAQSAAEVRPSLLELSRAHLIFETVPGRFGCHELLRVYGAELGQEPAFAAESTAAVHRLLDYYLHSAYSADVARAPSRERFLLQPPTPGASPQQFSDPHAATSWLDTERPVLLAVIEQDSPRADSQHSWQLAATMEIYLDRNGRWQEQFTAQTAALTAARRLDDLRGKAYAHRALGLVSGRLAKWPQARDHLQHAFELFGQVGDPAGQGQVHRYRAFLANERGRHHDALENYQLACVLYRSAGQVSGEASIYNEIGWTYILLGEYAKALEECGRALAMHQAQGHRNGQAAAWDSLGYAHHHLGQYDKALAAFEHALQLYRALGDRYLEADTLVHMGDTHQAAVTGDLGVFAWRQALEILDGIGHPDAASVRDKLRKLMASTGPISLGG
jgi:DNA-binding SARP family transcriptional activator/tetratricopeptide (TPR) repeat protein